MTFQFHFFTLFGVLELLSANRTLDTKGVFEKGIIEVQHQWWHKICKYTVGLSFQVKSTIYPTFIEEHEYMSHVFYASAVGSLMYAIVCIRPDLSQAVSMVSRYMHDLCRGHWEEVK